MAMGDNVGGCLPAGNKQHLRRGTDQYEISRDIGVPESTQNESIWNQGSFLENFQRTAEESCTQVETIWLIDAPGWSVRG
jgi:hypothetical protein